MGKYIDNFWKSYWLGFIYRKGYKDGTQYKET